MAPFVRKATSISTILAAEIKATANLQNPNILALHDFGEADSFLFYVMPYVQEETLGDRLERESHLPVDEAVKIATEIADALQAAHEQGVIHRDIKPANILLNRGRPLVADFGIALAVSTAGGGRLTETGLSLGAPHYMSPEQATGDQVVAPSTDIYALGSVLYEMLVGEPPYTGSNAQAVLGKIIQGKPVSAREERGAVPANVDAAVCKSLKKLPADWFKSSQEFAKALADDHSRYGAAVAGVGEWRRPVSASEGGHAMWSRDGRELFYLHGDSVMAVAVTTDPEFDAGRPELLFVGDLFLNRALRDHVYDLASDGRFLRIQNASASRFIMVTNFFKGLKERLPN